MKLSSLIYIESGAMLRYLRCKSRLSQRKLATSLGVTRQTVASWESKDSILNLVSLEQMVKLNEIFNLKDEVDLNGV